MSQVLDLEELVDGQEFGRFNINLLVWSFLAMVADGSILPGLLPLHRSSPEPGTLLQRRSRRH